MDGDAEQRGYAKAEGQGDGVAIERWKGVPVEKDHANLVLGQRGEQMCEGKESRGDVILIILHPARAIYSDDGRADVGAVAQNQVWGDMICMHERSGRGRPSAGRSDIEEVSNSIKSTFLDDVMTGHARCHNIHRIKIKAIWPCRWRICALA